MITSWVERVNEMDCDCDAGRAEGEEAIREA